MKILGIDTSSKFLNIALSEDEDIIKEESYLLDRKHAGQLVPKVMGLLKKSRVPINKIDAFIIGLGPGSFTGLRIGVSAIKGFGIASGKPCIGVASMDSIACNVSDKDKDVVPIIDAKRGQVYSAIYRRQGGLVVRLSDYMVLPIDKLMAKIKTQPVFLGDGVSLYRNDILSINKKAIFLEEKYWYPGAGNLIKLGFSRVKKAKKTNMNKLTPLYLYPEDCQVKKT
ncbi:MAG: tRNA (adenosine(37)-N6)-threonylcarbamoyltransferase complex dimerization subunit type 1 TsaB [Candidatus Omnitrophica bacterium]|nr:tRNA (adenosine(37)-N6)-threonylcarbamoyltransferase complex dimerization subunit type 1 TsaB [Candidatus Omnitrophota bacterium]